jgi:UDP-glucose 4-epimerase
MLVLVGGSGFIGRHVAIRAHDTAIPTVVVSRNPDLEFLSRHAPSASALPLSVFHTNAGEELLKKATALIYLASESVPSSNVDQPLLEIPLNVEPAFNTFLRVGQLRPELPILFLSSGGTVYGRSDRAPIPESAPLNPISPYGLGKVITEQCLRFCGEMVGQRYIILRASNAIGRWHRNSKQGLAMAVVRAISSGTPLQIYGDGTAVRDYLDADDLADAVICVTNSAGSTNGVWNVSSGIGYTVLEMIDMIEKVIGKRPEIVFRPLRNVDLPCAVLDPSKILRDFGWRAKTPLLTALKKALTGLA